jgi:hypothetical protein
MGTRAVFTFKDEYASFAVYKHWDGYPEGAAEFLTNAIPLSWGLDRFEADEFAAAFVAGNKKKGGDIRLTTYVADHGDLDYHYELTAAVTNGQLIIRASEVEYERINLGYDEVDYQIAFKEIFYGRLKDFVDKYGSSDTKKMWNTLDKSPNKLYEGV